MNIEDNEPLPTPEISENEVRITSLPEAWQKRFWDETGAITMPRAGWVPLDNWMAFAERHQSLETSNSYPAMDS